VTDRKITQALRQVGVEKGDILLVHSDVSLVMKMMNAQWWEDALRLLQQSFEAALGEEGTLVVPTFNYDFCHGKPYSHEQTPSLLGKFTNHIRRGPRAVRSLHPILSFAAIGPQAHALCDEVSHSAYGVNSVFDRLFHAKAKLLFFNVSFETCAFIHHVEQQRKVDYRYLKSLTGPVSVGGKESIETFDFYVRYLDQEIETLLQPFAERLERLGLMKRTLLEGGVLLQVSCQDVYREAMQALDENPYFLLARPPKPKATNPPNL